MLASKLFFNTHPGDPNGGGVGCLAVRRQLDETLRRLGTDHLDLCWMHDWDRNTPVEETKRVLDDLVGSGKVGYIGYCNVPAWGTAQARRWPCSGAGRR